MARKKSNNRAKDISSSRPQVKKRFTRRRVYVWPVLTLGVLVIGLMIYLFVASRQMGAIGERTTTSGRSKQTPSPLPSSSPKDPEQAAKDIAWDPAWPSLPNSGTPAQPIEQVHAAYAFALRRPEVMQYMPCYCGCEKQGHRSVRDCFVKGQSSEGIPKWDGMGFT